MSRYIYTVELMYLIAALMVIAGIVILTAVAKWYEPSIDVSVMSVRVGESFVNMTIRVVNTGGGSDRLADAFMDVNGTVCRAVGFYDAGSMQLLGVPITIPPKSNTTLIISFWCPRSLQDQQTTSFTLNLVFERTEIVRIRRETTPIIVPPPPPPPIMR